MNRCILFLLLAWCSSMLASCDDGTGNGFIVSAFITFALGIIPAGLVLWLVSLMLNGKNETKNTELNGCLLPGLIILALIFGFIIKTALFR